MNYKIEMKKTYFANRHSLMKHYLTNGSTRQANGDYLGAAFHFTKAIEVSEVNADAYLRRGIVRAILNDLYGAEQDYSKAIELDQNFTDAYFNRGLLWYRIDNCKDSLDDFLKVVEINPNFSGVHLLIGDLYWKNKDYARAVMYYTKAIEVDPSNMSAYYKRAHAKRVLMDYDGSLEDFNKFITLTPNVGQLGITKAIKRLFSEDIKKSKFQFSSLN
jgi:tetratricopeptide (TPR) repeat protein